MPYCAPHELPRKHQAAVRVTLLMRSRCCRRTPGAHHRTPPRPYVPVAQTCTCKRCKFRKINQRGAQSRGQSVPPVQAPLNLGLRLMHINFAFEENALLWPALRRLGSWQLRSGQSPQQLRRQRCTAEEQCRCLGC